ncbi:hypothetical protein C8J57DRAFT_1248616 [Mycena rebaudengoi]|nr:hypothetical protein C8J57DRAFT_1248616 [Mycena rebaudengoi]
MAPWQHLTASSWREVFWPSDSATIETRPLLKNQAQTNPSKVEAITKQSIQLQTSSKELKHIQDIGYNSPNQTGPPNHEGCTHLTKDSRQLPMYTRGGEVKSVRYQLPKTSCQDPGTRLTTTTSRKSFGWANSERDQIRHQQYIKRACAEFRLQLVCAPKDPVPSYGNFKIVTWMDSGN